MSLYRKSGYIKYLVMSNIWLHQISGYVKDMVMSKIWRCQQS